MKKFGFTLAEILITLGIIGVVAALTMPGLVSGSRSAQYSAALRVTVSNLENAFRAAISEEGADSLFSTRMWSNAPINSQATANARFAAFAGNLGTYLAIDGFETIPAATYYTNRNVTFNNMNANGSRGDVRANFPGNGETFPIELKTGATIFIRTYARNAADNAARRNNIINLGGTMYDNAADIFIDVNGVKPPNTFGRDIFGFGLAGNGTLHAYGSTSVSIYDNLNTNDTWNGNGNAYRCTDAVKSNGGIGCTGRLISNGYEFDY